MPRSKKGLTKLDDATQNLSLGPPSSASKRKEFWISQNKAVKPTPRLPSPPRGNLPTFISPFDDVPRSDTAATQAPMQIDINTQLRSFAQHTGGSVPITHNSTQATLSADSECPPATSLGKRNFEDSAKEGKPDGGKRIKTDHKNGNDDENLMNGWLAYSTRGGYESEGNALGMADFLECAKGTHSPQEFERKLRQAELKDVRSDIRASNAASAQGSPLAYIPAPVPTTPSEFLRYLSSIFKAREDIRASRLSTAASYISADPEDMELYLDNVRDILEEYEHELLEALKSANKLEKALAGHGKDQDVARDLTDRMKRRIEVFQAGMALLGLKQS